MTHDEQTNLASDIRSGLQARNAARNAEVPRPAILDETAPVDAARRARWEQDRETACSRYAEQLLGKARLTADEQLFLARSINEHISQGR
jgi:hypothetical protein